MKEYTIDNVISNLDSLNKDLTEEQRTLLIIAQNILEQNFKANSYVGDILK